MMLSGRNIFVLPFPTDGNGQLYGLHFNPKVAKKLHGEVFATIVIQLLL